MADKIIEIDFEIDEKIKQMDNLLTDVDNSIDSITKELINDVDLILSNKAFSENTAKSESVPDEAIDFVDYFSEIIKMPDAEKLGEKKKYKKYLNFIKDILQNFRKDFYEPTKKSFKLLVSEFEKRRDSMVQYRNENNNDNKKPKLEPEPKLTEPQRETIKKELGKDEIIKAIVRRHPDYKIENLNAMSKDDLIEISRMLSINLLDLNTLKAPANATKEQKELIQNLENLRRQREAEEEYEKLKQRITGEEELSKQEKTKKLLDKSAKMIKKQNDKPIGFETKVKKNKISKIDKKFVDLQKSGEKVKLNENFMLGLGEVDEQRKIENKLMNIAKSNFKSPVRKTTKKIVNIYDDGDNNEQHFDYASDIKQSKEPQHKIKNLVADKQIQKSTERNDDAVGLKNLANAYRKFIKSQETH
eukprot:gene7981-12447_t